MHVEDLCCESLWVDVEELGFQFSKRRFHEAILTASSLKVGCIVEVETFEIDWVRGSDKGAKNLVESRLRIGWPS